MQPRRVKGVLFADYVRMIRRNKSVDWARHLDAQELALAAGRVEPDAWYPMEAFERLGNAIFAEVARGDLQAVRLFGRASVQPLVGQYPALIAPGDPMESIMRFHVLRSTFFDFPAMSVVMLTPEQAELSIHYHMGPVAEEAASVQALGFFEGLLELAGAGEVRARFSRESWRGAPETLLTLEYRGDR